MEIKPRTFAAQMMAYFGCLSGQSAIEFGKEIITLPDSVKAEFIAMLNAAGYPVKS